MTLEYRYSPVRVRLSPCGKAYAHLPLTLSPVLEGACVPPLGVTPRQLGQSNTTGQRVHARPIVGILPAATSAACIILGLCYRNPGSHATSPYVRGSVPVAGVTGRTIPTSQRIASYSGEFLPGLARNSREPLGDKAFPAVARENRPETTPLHYA